MFLLLDMRCRSRSCSETFTLAEARYILGLVKSPTGKTWPQYWYRERVLLLALQEKNSVLFKVSLRTQKNRKEICELAYRVFGGTKYRENPRRRTLFCTACSSRSCSVSASRLSGSPVPSKALHRRADSRPAAAFPWKLPGSQHQGREPISMPAPRWQRAARVAPVRGERRWDHARSTCWSETAWLCCRRLLDRTTSSAQQLMCLDCDRNDQVNPTLGILILIFKSFPFLCMGSSISLRLFPP